jgi:hypothetical protein
LRTEEAARALSNGNPSRKAAVTQPNDSNAAQQRQDKATKTGVRLDPLANRMTDIPDGAVHGGEAAKPGQMEGDADIDANAPESAIESAVKRGQSGIAAPEA